MRLVSGIGEALHEPIGRGRVRLETEKSGVGIGACWYFEVGERFWLPVLMIYGIGAIAHILGFGLMALNMQIKVSTDLVIGRMNHRAREHREQER